MPNQQVKKLSSDDVESLLLQLSGDAISIVSDPTSDSALVELVKIQELANSIVADTKKQIEAAALKRSADFKGLRSDHVVISYRPAGAKYKPAKGVDPATLPAEYVKASTRYFLQAGAIEDYHDKTGKFPEGVEVAERKKSIVIEVLDDEQEKVQG